MLPVWGFFAGFAFGAGLVAELADERFLGTVLGWVLGLVFALIFAVFAYLYFAVAVIIAMAAFGFAIGSGLVVALGIDWNWVAVLVGVAVGAIVGLASVFGNMPMIVLVVISSVAGAIGVVAGLMLLVGSLDSADFTHGAFTDKVQDSWGWYLTLLVLAFAGIAIQARQRTLMRRSVNEVWYAESPLTRTAVPVTAATVSPRTAPSWSRVDEVRDVGQPAETRLGVRRDAAFVRARGGDRCAGGAEVAQGRGCGEADGGAMAVTAVVAVHPHRFQQARSAGPGRPHRDSRDRVGLTVVPHQAAGLRVGRSLRHLVPPRRR